MIADASSDAGSRYATNPGRYLSAVSTRHPGWDVYFTICSSSRVRLCAALTELEHPMLQL